MEIFGKEFQMGLGGIRIVSEVKSYKKITIDGSKKDLYKTVLPLRTIS